MFTCCHPSLNLDAQVALTLRSLAGMSTAEIARAFLVPERTMGQRLFRAKQKVAHAGIPFRVPPAHLLPERLPAVLHVLYLLFNEGYGDPDKLRLATEAIRLARVLMAMMPDEPEAQGMLALMLLHGARRPARIDDSGALVTLDEQDRSLWDQAQIAEGTAICERALRRRRAGPFQIQAAIAACHATAPVAAATDWPQIVGLYEQLAQVAPSAIVDLNRAVAIGMADGPEARRCPWSRRSPRAATWTGTTFCTRPAPTCCDGPAGVPRRPRATGSRSIWHPPRLSAGSSAIGSTGSDIAAAAGDTMDLCPATSITGPLLCRSAGERHSHLIMMPPQGVAGRVLPNLVPGMPYMQ